MKNATKALALLLLFFVQGCNNKDCEDLLCFTPPFMFVFDIVDKDSGENLFTNGTYSPDQIEVINKGSQTNRAFDFIAEDQVNLIRIGSIGWESEIAEVVLKIGDQDILELHVDTERVNKDCCTFSEYNEIRIENADYEQDSQTGIYTVFID